MTRGSRRLCMLISALAVHLCACAPAVLWHGANAERTARAQVLSSFGGQYLDTGGDPGKAPRFDAIAPDGIVFSPSGDRIAYAGVRGDDWFMVVDGVENGSWTGVAEPRFSRDGRRFAFLAQRGVAWRVVIDGEAFGPYAAVQSDSLRFSPDARHVAWVLSGRTCSRLVVDGRRVPTCRDRIFPLRVLNDGTIATVIAEEGKHRFLLGETLGPPADEIGEWIVTPDGAHSAYAARTEARWAAVVDGQPHAPCDAVTRLRFGNGGRTHAHVCREGEWSRVVIDGVPGAAFRVVRWLALAKSSPRFAAVVSDERGAWVLTDSDQLGPYTRIVGHAFDPGTGELAFVARKTGATVIVHRGTETQVPRVVEGSLALSEDGAHWAAVVGEAATRTLYACIDGRRGPDLGADDVFGEASPRLRAWMARLLKEELEARSTR